MQNRDENRPCASKNPYLETMPRMMGVTVLHTQNNIQTQFQRSPCFKEIQIQLIYVSTYTHT